MDGIRLACIAATRLVFSCCNGKPASTARAVASATSPSSPPLQSAPTSQSATTPARALHDDAAFAAEQARCEQGVFVQTCAPGSVPALKQRVRQAPLSLDAHVLLAKCMQGQRPLDRPRQARSGGGGSTSPGTSSCKASKVAADAELATFGPDMTLAADLLARSARAAVARYLAPPF